MTPTPPREASCASCGSTDPAERRLMFHAPENRCTDHFHDEPCPECGWMSGHKESCPGYFDPLSIPKITTRVRLPQVPSREASFEEELREVHGCLDDPHGHDFDLCRVCQNIRAAHARELAAARAETWREAQKVFQKHANERGHHGSVTVRMAVDECEQRAAAAEKGK